VQGPTPGSG